MGIRPSRVGIPRPRRPRPAAQPSVVVAAVAERPGVNVAAPPWVDQRPRIGGRRVCRCPGRQQRGVAQSADTDAANEHAHGIRRRQRSCPAGNHGNESADGRRPARRWRRRKVARGRRRPAGRTATRTLSAGRRWRTIYQAGRSQRPAQHVPARPRRVSAGGARRGESRDARLEPRVSPGADAAAQRPLPEQQSPPPSSAQLEGNIIPISPESGPSMSALDQAFIRAYSRRPPRRAPTGRRSLPASPTREATAGAARGRRSRPTRPRSSGCSPTWRTRESIGRIGVAAGKTGVVGLRDAGISIPGLPCREAQPRAAVVRRRNPR